MKERCVVSVKLSWVEGADRDMALAVNMRRRGRRGRMCGRICPAARRVTLAPGARALIPTGLRMEIPPGFEIQVRPRSGLALKHAGSCWSTRPGTIDSDYRGELGVILLNAGTERSSTVEPW